MISTSRRGLDRLTRKTIFELGTSELTVQTETDSAKAPFAGARRKRTEGERASESEGGLQKTSSEKCSLH